MLFRSNLKAPAVPARPPSAYLRRFFYDTILHHPSALSYLRDLVGSDRLLLGTDYPFPVDDRAPLALLQASGCSARDLAQIAGENARQLFKL